MDNGKTHEKRLKVEVNYTPVPDGGVRLSRAIDMLLKAGVRRPKQSAARKEVPSCQTPEEDALTGGVEGDNSHE